MTTGFYTHADCTLHEMGADHPECPQRLAAIEDRLIAAQIAPWLERHDDAPPASLEDVERAHSALYVADLKKRGDFEQGHEWIDADTMMNPHTWQAALRAAGAAISATDAVIDGHLHNAFCSIRPPGHHATRDQAMGFCFLGNVAIAARHALDVRGLDRVAIVDFDVHHGNGTEDIFRGDERVLMVSFFQHPFYPYSGAEGGQPNMVNVPVPAYTKGDGVRHIVTEQWLPRLRTFAPQMLFISAGFDAHREDDMGQMGLVEADYAWITRQLVDFAEAQCEGRIVSCLEGGYNLSALGRSVAEHVRVLAGLD
ncbi:MAG: histone deacetylase family protein [Thiomonas arsenitoxydans]|uniref:Histone deacetylase family protein n=1 Tax=Thiomonas arsenitoxydans (strain DSM 22701 / CIP 110005 / 3As) TaxID=426114 RepID=A0A8I1MVY3_THIA3|nr:MULTISPECIES: histone deacetylase family protein [Thiomonas]MBN8743374.1 histone deacetylase family protein [Thiomonas arsenitoxydans]ODU98449.1 MAG: deacetylase [Thiomonas sp. SCN 64-16]